ncbi:hypothetical protein [Galactobacter valiniphilus]|uniref:hypothetical protein n=1 Tax=Galactobacter valiniphilus TaxID=2676122 RepID=UPI00373708D7
MRKALSLTLAGVLAGTGLLGAAATPAQADTVKPCVGVEGSTATPSVAPVLTLPAVLNADAPTRTTLSVTCHNPAAFTLTSGYLTVKRAPRDAAENVPATQLNFAPVTPTAITPTPNGTGSWTASVEVDIEPTGSKIRAGKAWHVSTSVTIPGIALGQRQSFQVGGATPLALPNSQTPTVTIAAGAHTSAAAELPSLSALGRPAEPVITPWGAGASLSYRWVDESGAELASGEHFTPSIEGQRFALELTGTWPDGTQTTVPSAFSTTSADPLAGRVRIDAIGDAFPYGDGLGYSIVRVSDGQSLAANEDAGKGAWYEVSATGAVTGYKAPLTPTSAYVAGPHLAPAEAQVGQRFVYIRNVASWNAPVASNVVTIVRAKAPGLANATGYTGAWTTTSSLATVRPGAKLTLGNPWPIGAPVSYSWLRDGKTIVSSGDPAKAAYTVTLADVGHTLQGATATTSTAFAGTEVKAKAFKVAPALMVAPKLTLNRSTAVVGQKLSVTASGGTRGATVKYQWYRNNKPIKGATGTSYTLVGADWGQRVGVETRSTLTGYTSASAAAYLGRDVGYGTIVKGKLAIKGKGKVGSKLTASRSGTSTPGLSVQYQWYRNGKMVWGAEKSTYKLSKADRGKRVTVVAALYKQGYKQTSLTAKTGRVL